VRDLGKDLAVEARSGGDGIIEAIRWRGVGFVLGVQWHPEFHVPQDTRLLPREPLIEAFLRAAAVRKEEAHTA
jgi:putative glutamine amidotransferase